MVLNVRIVTSLILLRNIALCSEKDLPFADSDLPFFFFYRIPQFWKITTEICSGVIERIWFILTYAIRKQVG